MNTHFTFAERHIWANLGWAFCEFSFRCPEWLWRIIGTHANTLGNWFYDKAYDRYEQENGLGGGTGPF